MERIMVGVYFSNDDVKEKFIEECASKITNIFNVNQKGEVFDFIHKVSNDHYTLYHYPMKEGAIASVNKLQSVIFVVDDSWIEFEEMFEGVAKANIDNAVILHTGTELSLEDLKINGDIGSYIKKAYSKCLVKRILLEDANEEELLSLFESIKEHISSDPFVFNDLSISYSGPTSIKCSGTLDYGFFHVGDRIAIYSKGGREVVGKVVSMFAFSAHPTRTAKKGQSVRFVVELEEKYFIEGEPIQAVSKDRVVMAKKFNALVTMYDAEFDGYRVLDSNSLIEFHLLGTRYAGKILDTGVGYNDGEEQRFLSVSSGNSMIFSMSFPSPIPLVNGMTFYIEKPWSANIEPGSYGYAKIIEVVE